ncbi:MAG: hypothetical protein COZ06_31175 [Armatimonadetes bacterium CG_4_10_14_3_um_filter_66_18]|nr:RNA polymerase sigma factor [Armatimonadota bacterium]OIP10235.1 MAG: hypothetical protein AUJ96_04170 [Armatimonadetes bacterium CG2_30_66_41]PIU94017.1 MAG: hypothetical protein COS65_09815 [Armatimonadetes bacterium CG06_land_8_20_14_3_00_66_21]PIX43229.1 MAG: hypothetical protein COZ57_19580 [Armatimonadetes bacterium CG_4_8_14_3_um_filter_66_20]PIY38463.1 MAG: hypothetical protein COZ06_31175 [Armatimonadetes bacterium CG_4_10_14_3_um_filter_66_18]PIZ36416.1 MAG: hypothetical protein C
MMPSDEEIIRQVQRGDRERFGELHLRHYPRVRRYVSRFVFDEEEAMDLALEVFVRAYRSVDSYETQERVTYLAYLLRIAQNLVTDYRRRLPPSQLAPVDEFEPEAPAARRSFGEELAAWQTRRRVQWAMSQVSKEDQQVLTLAYVEELSRQEIAHVLGKPSVTAVTTQLYRATRRVRALLEEPKASAGREEQQASESQGRLR